MVALVSSTGKKRKEKKRKGRFERERERESYSSANSRDALHRILVSGSTAR